MEQDTARIIISSLSSLYPLRSYEEEAINTILIPRELVTNDDSEYGYTDCPSCGANFHYYNAKFCWNCGQPFRD